MGMLLVLQVFGHKSYQSNKLELWPHDATSQGIIRVITIHPVGIINEQKFMAIHAIVAEMLNSVWTKVNWQIDIAIPRAMPLAWLKIQGSHTEFVGIMKKQCRNVFNPTLNTVLLLNIPHYYTY